MCSNAARELLEKLKGWTSQVSSSGFGGVLMELVVVGL